MTRTNTKPACLFCGDRIIHHGVHRIGYCCNWCYDADQTARILRERIEATEKIVMRKDKTMFENLKSFFKGTPAAKPAPIVTAPPNLGGLRTPGPAAKLPQPIVVPIVKAQISLPEVQRVPAQPPQVLVDGEPLDWDYTNLDLEPRSPAMIRALLKVETAEQTQSRIANDLQRYRRSRGLI